MQEVKQRGSGRKSTLRGGFHDHLYVKAPPEIADHPLFNGGSVGVITADAPKYHPTDHGGTVALKKHLDNLGLKHEFTHGSYGAGRENSFIVQNPTREQMFHLGHAMGQEAVIYGHNGKHEMLYTHGKHIGQYNPSISLLRFSKEQPDDYYTHLPGRGYIALHFNFDQRLDSAVKHTLPPSKLLETPTLAKSLNEVRAHPHGYPWHEGDSSYHHRTVGHGILLTEKEAAAMMPLAKAEEPTLEPAHATNEQAAGTGVSTYAKFAAPYGAVNKGTPSNLKHYPLDGKREAVNKLVADHGYTPYYAGGKHGRADLSTKNYNTGHLMLWDPSSGSGGDFGHEDYTDSWRKTHELAHALTLKDVNAKYGEGRRMGALGKQRDVREAKRSVEWEHMAVHKQRELCKQIGVHISDGDFHKELNTVMHDAVHRAVTGKFTEPAGEGFVPHSHKVPLTTALSLIDEANSPKALAKTITAAFGTLLRRTT